MLVIFFVILFGISLSYGKYEDCGSKEGVFVKFHLSNCSNEDEVCLLKANSRVKTELTFTNVETSKVRAQVCGRVSGLFSFVCVPYSLESPKDDGCLNGVHCPVERHQIETYSLFLDVPSNHVGISVVSQLALKDDNDETIACTSIPFSIVG